MYLSTIQAEQQQKMRTQNVHNTLWHFVISPANTAKEETSNIGKKDER